MNFNDDQNTIRKDLLDALAKEDSLDGLFDATMSGEREKFIEYIIFLAEKLDFFGYEKNEFSREIRIRLVQDDFYKALKYDISEKLLKSCSLDGKISRNDIVQIMNRNVFWFLFAIAVKKCLGPDKSNAQLTIAQLRTYIGPWEPRLDDSYNVLLNCFNYDVREYSLSKTPQLSLLLHKQYYKPHWRTRLKNVNRVLGKTKKIMVIYKLTHKNAHFFDSNKHKIPENFVRCIIKVFIRKK